jgi:hypothetical protein
MFFRLVFECFSDVHRFIREGQCRALNDGETGYTCQTRRHYVIAFVRR